MSEDNVTQMKIPATRVRDGMARLIGSENFIMAYVDQNDNMFYAQGQGDYNLMLMMKTFLDQEYSRQYSLDFNVTDV